MTQTEDGPVRIDISNVALWFLKEKANGMLYPDDYPHLISPWINAVYSYTAPIFVKLIDENDFTAVNKAYKGIQLTNAHVITSIHDYDEEFHRPQLEHAFPYDDVGGMQDARWIQTFHVGLGDSLESSRMVGGLIQMLDGDGTILHQSIAKHKLETSRTFGYDVKYEVSPMAYTYPVLFANSLAHCRNVEVRDRPISRQQRRMAERTGKPVTVYKELVIDAFRKQVRYESEESGDNEIKRAIHICRGHFATYTDASPLFGRVTGTFWKPMHVRGHKEIGEVKKTYKVDPPPTH
jgi:hypothetical protein